jgi:putative ATP-grasp target RiPP
VFAHFDRFPLGSPVPRGEAAPVPWIVGRVGPYPPFEGAVYGRIELDAVTQTARYFAPDGALVMAPGHGTGSGTNPPTGTTGQGDRQGGDAPDSDSGNDTDQ